MHHVGAFPDLEDQQCQWSPGEKSPDRLDALVWAVTELMFEDDDWNPLAGILVTGSAKGWNPRV